LFTLLAMFVSHPSVSLLLLQSAKPEAHAPLHTPLAQDGLETLLPLQVWLHPPQWVALVWVLVSQPLVTNPSQLPNPALQAIAHVPDWQRAVPLVELHTVPQPPQLEGLVATFVSQPLLTNPSQSAQPALQDAIVQLPLEHPAVPLATEQLFPQLPQ
jgi:hypothetical protein